MTYQIRPLAAALAAIVLAIAAGPAFAQGHAPSHGPASLGACVNLRSGEIKAAGSAAACKVNEQFVSIPLGTPAAPGVAGYEVVRADIYGDGYGFSQYVVATCPAGKKVLSGHWYTSIWQSIHATGGFIDATDPEAQKWVVEFEGYGNFSVFAVCAF